jgi:PKD repeat protein
MVASSFVILADADSQNGTLGSSRDSRYMLARRLSIDTMPASVNVGTPLGFLLTVLDHKGSVFNKYKGTVEFWSSDPDAVVPPSYTFVESDSGQHFFPVGSVVFNSAGTQILLAYDVKKPKVSGKVSIDVIDDRTVLLDEHFDSWDSLDSHWTIWNCTDPVYNSIGVENGTLLMTNLDVYPVNDANNAMANWTYPMYYDSNLTIRFRIFLPYDDDYKEGFWGQFVAVVLYDTSGVPRLIMRFLMDTWSGAPNGFTYVSEWNEWAKICGVTAGWHDCAIGLVRGSSTWMVMFDGVLFKGLTFSGTGWNASDLSKLQLCNALREEPVAALIDDVRVEKLGIPTPPEPNQPPVAILTVDSIDGLNVNVNGASSYDPDGTVIWYSWNWGDGTPPTPPSPSAYAGHTYPAEGGYTIRLQVFDNLGESSLAYRFITVSSQTQPKKFTAIYDMFQQPWGEWYKWRYPSYGTEIILSNVSGQYTMLYNPDRAGRQGIIYAPYRVNVSAFDLTNLNVANPEFMPALGDSNTTGCNAEVNLYFNYLDRYWWNSYWVPTWSSNPSWPLEDIMGLQMMDGFTLGVIYEVDMNRQAAQAWLGLPIGADPAAWWSANSETYRGAWIDWILNEGNSRLDIWPAYEWPLVDLGTMMDLQPNPYGGLKLTIGHFSWGYEILMTRWLSEAGICSHEPWYEDFRLDAHYLDSSTQWVAFDACCQNSLHAVKANQTYDGSAWVWEPNAIDYVPSWYTPGGVHASRYDPYENLTYTSWNAGDPMFGQEVRYENTPTWFNVEANARLAFYLPQGNNVIGYVGTAVPPDAIKNIIRYKDYSAYNNITIHGSMSLGYYAVTSNATSNGTGGPDLGSMYDPVNKILTIVGPVDFDNVRHPDGSLYHGAPWIEFNVAPGGNIPPVATITLDFISNLTVAVNGYLSFDPDGAITGYSWTWGDGSPPTPPSSEPFAMHTYMSEGGYTIRLQVSDNLGASNYAYIDVYVTLPPPPPGYDWYPRTIPNGHYVNMTHLNTMYGPGAAVDSIGSPDHGYEMMGTHNGSYVIGPDGTITVRGYFMQFDTLNQYDWPGRRFVAVYVLDSSAASIISSALALSHTDAVDTWYYREVVIGGLMPGSSVKIGIGRGDNWSIDWSLMAAWAGVSIEINPSQNMPPFAVISLDSVVGLTVQVSGRSSFDLDGRVDLYSWNWGDGTLPTPPSFYPWATHTYAMPGEYGITLQVTDDKGATGSANMTVAVLYEPKPFELPFEATDVVIDGARNYAYITDKAGKMLRFVNLETGFVDSTVQFALMPEALAMSPDNSQLYVALLTREHSPVWFDWEVPHVGRIAVFDLNTRNIAAEYEINEDPWDMLVTSNGQLVVSSGSGQWSYVRVYDAKTGAELGNAYPVYERSNLALHPSERIVYAADNGLSPSDVTRFDLYPSGRIVEAGDSPYHGDYRFWGDLWISPRGDYMVTRGGDVFTAGKQFNRDMVYITSMATELINDLLFLPANDTIIAAEGTGLKYYSMVDFSLMRTVDLGASIEFIGFGWGRLYAVDVGTSLTTIIRV